MFSRPLALPHPSSLGSRTGPSGVLSDRLERVMDRTAALDIVERMREGSIILDNEHNVLAANRAFYEMFDTNARLTLGRCIHDLANGQWNIPEVRRLLEGKTPRQESADWCEVEHEFPCVGRMIVRINARMIGPGSTQTNSVLMTFDDVTEIVDERRYQQMLSAELVHRVKNNLQIVSAFVALEAERAPPACATGYEALQTRIDAIASLYSAVSTNGVSDPVQLDRYIARVAKTVEASVLGKKSEMELLVNAEPIEVSADRASLVGIITNELVTNAAKHAFRAGSGKVMVALWREGETIVLSVRDNGCGMDPFRITPGLGTQLISRFVDQLGGVLETESGASGTTRTVRIPVSISEARARKKGTCIPVARDVPTAGMTVNKATVARPDA